MGAKNQTILIVVDQGFASRYLLRTDIFKILKDSSAKIVILTPNADEEYFVKEFANRNVFIEQLNKKAYEGYSKNKVQKFLRNIRWYVMNGDMDLHTINMRYNIYKKNRPKDTVINKIYNYFFDLVVSILRKSKWLRKIEIKLESKIFTPMIHEELFKKYHPDKMIVTSLGYFGYDHYLMREAKKHGVKIISIILSWDNTSSKGMPGAFADYIIAWSDNMKKELIDYLDIEPEKIFVGGIAHFDDHYRVETHWTREKLYSHFNLYPERKIVFFALRSPNKYPWNPDIVNFLAKAIEDEIFIYPCQLLVRLHPIYFKTKNSKYIYKKDIERLIELKNKYKYLFYDIPEILSKKLPMDMPKSEMSKLSTILRHSSIMLSFYSTLMLEASIFDVPMINVCLYTHNENLEQKDLQIIYSPHIQRIIQTGGVRSAFNERELIEYINMYLAKPEIDRAGREKIKLTEVSVYAGVSGQKIAEYLLNI